MKAQNIDSWRNVNMGRAIPAGRCWCYGCPGKVFFPGHVLSLPQLLPWLVPLNLPLVHSSIAMICQESLSPAVSAPYLGQCIHNDTLSQEHKKAVS